MKIGQKLPEGIAALRARAEISARENADLLIEKAENMSPEDAERMIHELVVHQFELEMQNEELRRTQIELDAARARYFALYDLAPVGYCTLSEKGLILEANLSLAALLDVGRAALVNQPFTRFIRKEDQDTFYLHRKLLAKTGDSQSFELRMVNEGGAEFRAHLIAAAAHESGAPALRVVVSDITGRKRSEEALEHAYLEAQTERLRLEAVLAVLPTGVAITDADGKTIQFNTEYERIWGGPRPVVCSIEDYAVFKGWWAETGEAIQPEEWASARAVNGGKVVVGQVLEIERFDGSRAFVINSASPVLDTSGEIIGSVVAIHEITKMREADLRIQELNESLGEHVAAVEAVNRELDAFSHSVSHDLRAPLRFMSRIAHELLNAPEAPLPECAGERVAMIQKSTDEMAQLIKSLLLFSQVGRKSLKTNPVDLRKLFEAAAGEQFTPQLRSGVEIEIQDLAPCRGDRTLLREVVMNLLENAVKFTRNREQARITIGSTETDGEIVYFVHDNGVGFDMSRSAGLFQSFQRLHKTEEFEGTGIGLALVKRIIERHGGRIWATGEVGRGASFYFTLGAAKAPE